MTDMEMAMIRALAAIDRELGLPGDGCNSTAQTLAAIKQLQAEVARGRALALTVMADNGNHKAS